MLLDRLVLPEQDETDSREDTVTGRGAHLVGSLPGQSAEEAMSLAIDVLGPRLASLPDGETGDRHDWIIHIIESFRSHPDLALVSDGDWSDYDKIPRFRVRKGHHLFGASLDFGHVEAAGASLPVFELLKAKAQLPDLKFQVGTPGDFDMAMFTLGPAAALRHRRAFTEATLNEVRQVNTLAEGNAVFQIEVPAELVLMAKAPRVGQPALARLLGGHIATLASGAAPGTSFGIHLCLGDMNHRALGRMSDASPLVALTNAIVKAWPAGRPLDFVHAPFAAADDPPPVDDDFYAPLARLALPSPVRFVAGIAHEDQPLADQLRVRATVERALGRPVDISTSCGLGRRTPEAATAAIKRIGQLCDD